MKYFLFALITLSCLSCEHAETPEERYKRIEDSALAVEAREDSIANVAAAKEKKTLDSIAEIRGRAKNICPELVPFFELSYRMTDLLRSDVPADTLNIKFEQMRDSILKMEAKILGPKFSKMDSVCRKMFLDRMLEKTSEISDAIIDKLKK